MVGPSSCTILIPRDKSKRSSAENCRVWHKRKRMKLGDLKKQKIGLHFTLIFGCGEGLLINRLKITRMTLKYDWLDIFTLSGTKIVAYLLLHHFPISMLSVHDVDLLCLYSLFFWSFLSLLFFMSISFQPQSVDPNICRVFLKICEARSRSGTSYILKIKENSKNLGDLIGIWTNHTQLPWDNATFKLNPATILNSLKLKIARLLSHLPADGQTIFNSGF